MLTYQKIYKRIRDSLGWINMADIPDYIGPMAMGLEMGVIVPGIDIVDEVFESVKRCYDDDLLDDNDIVCITESVVARAQDNYVTVDEVSNEIRDELGLKKDGTIGVVFPITSRNRFSMILESIAGAVPDGKVVVQMSYPCDEVGNQTISPDFVNDLDKEVITMDDIHEGVCKHPITEVNYIEYYKGIIEDAGAEPKIVLCNDPLHILDHDPDAVIAADIHTRFDTKNTICQKFDNCITLCELFNEGESCSDWGLLGSNMSSGGRLKLAPRDGNKVVKDIQKKVKDELGVQVEVLIYGDGAYKDPTSGIYELADPSVTVASTDGLNRFRRGVKYKFLADTLYHEGKDVDEIEEILQEKKDSNKSENAIEREGTTPRRMEDLLGSLADLVSGSADAGTPVVLVKNFLN